MNKKIVILGGGAGGLDMPVGIFTMNQNLWLI